MLDKHPAARPGREREQPRRLAGERDVHGTVCTNRRLTHGLPAERGTPRSGRSNRERPRAPWGIGGAVLGAIIGTSIAHRLQAVQQRRILAAPACAAVIVAMDRAESAASSYVIFLDLLADQPAGSREVPVAVASPWREFHAAQEDAERAMVEIEIFGSWLLHIAAQLWYWGSSLHLLPPWSYGTNDVSPVDSKAKWDEDRENRRKERDRFVKHVRAELKPRGVRDHLRRLRGRVGSRYRQARRKLRRQRDDK